MHDASDLREVRSTGRLIFLTVVIGAVALIGEWGLKLFPLSLMYSLAPPPSELALPAPVAVSRLPRMVRPPPRTAGTEDREGGEEQT